MLGHMKQLAMFQWLAFTRIIANVYKYTEIFLCIFCTHHSSMNELGKILNHILPCL